MSGHDKEGEKVIDSVSASTTIENGAIDPQHHVNGIAIKNDKNRIPSALKLVIPTQNDISREGLTSVSSDSAPSSSVNTSPDSISSHSHSVLSDADPSTPIPSEKKRTYSAHELHTWDNGNGPPSFNRSATITAMERKNSLQTTTPPSFPSTSSNFQVEIAQVSLPSDGVKEVEDDKNTHTVFTLEVRLVNGLRWVIEKRYSDFREFHDRMKKANNSVRNLHFPKKQYFRSKTQSVIEQRRMELEKYIGDILAVEPMLKMPIFNFLAVYAHLESYDRKKRRQQKEIDMKRMKNLLSQDELDDVQVAFQRLCTTKILPSKITKDIPSSPKNNILTTSLSSPLSRNLNDEKNDSISKTAFRRDVLCVFPDMPSTFAMRFMKGFSEKQNNEITQDEFLRAVAILRHGSKEDQLLFAFNMCDHDHLGKLQSTGLGNLLVALYGRPVIEKPEYKRLLNELFDYGRQRLVAEDFLIAMLKQPNDQIGLVLEWMAPFMQILCETANPILLELQEESNPLIQLKILEKETYFDSQEIILLQDSFLRYRTIVDGINSIDFELLNHDFQLNISDNRIIRLFSSFGPRANGIDIDIFSFVHALNIACRGTLDEKIKFGFLLFSNNKNELNRDDLFAMLQLDILLHNNIENKINKYFLNDIQNNNKISLYIDLILNENKYWTFEQFKKWSIDEEYEIGILNLIKKKIFLHYGIIPRNKKEEIEISKLLYQPYHPDQLIQGDHWYIIEPIWFEHWRKYIEFIPILQFYSNPKLKKNNKLNNKMNEKMDDHIIYDTDKKIIRPKYINNINLLNKEKLFQPFEDSIINKNFIIINESLWIGLKTWYGGGPEIKKKVIIIGNKTTLNIWNTEDEINKNLPDLNLNNSIENKNNYQRIRYGGSLGLMNLGNTCYMNSALQCIVNTPIFVDYFLSGMYMDDINRTSTLGMQGKLAEVYGKLLEDMWNSKLKVISPREFKKTIGKFNQAFRGNDQQDAQELIAFLLSGLSEDLNRIHEKPYIEQPDSDGRYDSDLADEWWRNHLKREVSIVVALFTGQYKSLLTCSSCNFKSARFEPFTFLQVPLPEPTHMNITIPFIFSDGKMGKKISLRLNIDASIYDLKKELVELCHFELKMNLITISDIKICEYSGSILVGYKADNRKLGQIRSIDRMIAFQLENLNQNVIEMTKFRRPSLIPYNDVIENDEINNIINKFELNMLIQVQSKGEWIPATIIDLTNEMPTIQYRHGEIEQVSRTRIKNRPKRLLYCSVLSRKLEYAPIYFKNPFRPTPFGMPDLVRFCPEMTTGIELYDMVWNRVKRFVKKNNISPIRHDISGPVQDIDQVFCHDGKHPFLLRRVEGKGLTDARTPWLLRSFGWTIPCNDQFVDILEDEAIAIDWDVNILKDVDMDKMKAIDMHPSVAKNDALDHGPVPLSHCLDAFSLEEKIDETYCSSCCQHQEMTKKLEIWRLPPVMVIQLKRFQYTQTYRRKLGTLVQFPIHGLNLASCVAPFEEFPLKYPEKNKNKIDEPIQDTTTCTEEPSINRVRRGYTNTNLEQSRCLETHYDLYGVVNHQGALGGGHYTAYAKNTMDGNWYCYDDERVRLIEESKIITASAYLCFYVRKDMADITVDDVYPPKKDGKITEEDIDRFVEESDKGKCALM